MAAAETSRSSLVCKYKFGKSYSHKDKITGIPEPYLFLIF
jgi:hypothetical protein